MTSARMTVSVPKRLLERVEAELLHDGEGRSHLVQRLFEDALNAAEEAELDRRYIRGWREQPLTSDELEWIDAATANLPSLGDGDAPSERRRQASS